MELRRALVRMLMLTATCGVAWSSEVLLNPGFETGTLAGWNTFTTANGTLGPGMPQVTTFSTNGGAPSLAAQFSVGQSSFGGFADLEGGGIFQTVRLSSGSLNISADIAAQAGSMANFSAGLFRLLIDRVPVATQDLGAIQADMTVRSSIVFASSVTGGNHEIAFEFLRPATSGAGAPFQFLDNVAFSGSAFPAFGAFDDFDAPEPGSLLLVLGGIAVGLVLAGRRRHSA